MKKWHPDRWMKDPKFAGEAKRRFQQIQEAYSGIFFLKLKKEEKNTHIVLSLCTISFQLILLGVSESDGL